MKNRIDEDYMYESKRLVEISDALRILQKKSLTYLKDYEKSCNFSAKITLKSLVFSGMEDF